MRKLTYILLLIIFSAAEIAAENLSRICLDGEWEFRQVGDTVWRTAEVPGCIHTDLMSCGIIEDPFYARNERSLQWIGEKDWEYRKTFHIDRNMVSVNNVWLVLEGVDTYAEISINGLPGFETDNMFRRWKFDISKMLKPGQNEILIKFKSIFSQDMPKYLSAPYRLQAWPNNDQSDIWLSLYARKAGYHYGWDWGPRLITAGLWKPVYIEKWERWSLESAHIKTLDLEKVSVKTGKAGKALMCADIEIESDSEDTAEITIKNGDDRIYVKEVLIEKGKNNIECPFTLKNPDLWWSNGLGDAETVEFEILVKAGGKIASHKVRTGIRTAEVLREDDQWGKSMTVRLNGMEVFCKGANWIPIDNFPDRRGRKDYIRLIEDAAEANMNMLRVWGGGLYESDIFYEVCDSLGIMVWQDMAFACGMFPSDDDYIEGVKQEVRDNVRRLRNHPSLILWCGNNENEISYYEWGWNRTLTESQREEYEKGMNRLFREAIPQAIYEEDNTRYYHPSSPVTGYNGIPYSMGDAHFWSVWKGGWVEEYLKPQNIARFMSEYGFIAYPEMHSLRKFIPDRDIRTDSPSMLAHHRAYDDVTRDPEFSNKMIRRYLERYAWIPEKFEDFVHMTQWFQAEAIKVAIEAHRRAKPYCMGTLFWQINDCWPAISWSSIDYYGRWKALHYYARKAFAPVLASPFVNAEGNISVRLISDRPDDFKGTLETYIMDFHGHIIYSSSKDCKIEEGGVSDLENICIKYLDGDRFLYVRMMEEGNVISENVFFNRFPKEYSRERGNIDIQAEESEDGIILSLQSDRLVRGLYLYTDREDDIFKDNHIDLIPGFQRNIQVKTEVDKEEFITTLKYKTL